MADTTVVPEALRAYAATSATMGGAVSAAAGINAAANTAALIPVFGVIGQEFLAAFISAQASHLLGVANLAAVHAGTAAAALSGAGTFEGADAGGAADIRAALRSDR